MQNIKEETIRQAAGGDIKAFESIYKTSSPLVYTIAQRISGSTYDAEDITQAVFLTIHKKLNQFRFESSFKTWIYRVTLNTAFNHMRQKQREEQRMKTFKAELPQREKGYSVGDPIIDKDQQDLAASLLNELNPDQKAVLVLRSQEGLSYQEIAELLKININTVRTRIKRAREKLLAKKSEVIGNDL